MAMFHLKDLKKNPVSVRYVEDTDKIFEIVAERLRRGRVQMVCSCSGQREAGWCRHLVGVLCDRGQFESEDDKIAFNNVVIGTAVEEAAFDLEHILERFATSYREVMELRPKTLSAKQLREFGHAAGEAGKYALGLAGAIDRFISHLKLKSEEDNESSSGKPAWFAATSK
jgi:hypothetical protein